jgi:RNA polymerase sigma-70 factor (ECF subfamily)
MASASLCRDWSDADLMAAVRRRDGAAYGELYRRHAGSVGACARAMLGAGPAGEDVVSEVFAALWASPEAFEAERGSLPGFLRLSARGRSIDVLRAEASRRQREAGQGRTAKVPRGVDAELLAAEADAAVRRAVVALPAGEREAVQLAFFTGMSYRAMAEHLGVAEGTLKSRIRRALAHLRASPEMAPGRLPMGALE